MLHAKGIRSKMVKKGPTSFSDKAFCVLSCRGRQGRGWSCLYQGSAGRYCGRGPSDTGTPVRFLLRMRCARIQGCTQPAGRSRRAHSRNARAVPPWCASNGVNHKCKILLPIHSHEFSIAVSSNNNSADAGEINIVFYILQAITTVKQKGEQTIDRRSNN